MSSPCCWEGIHLQETVETGRKKTDIILFSAEDQDGTHKQMSLFHGGGLHDFSLFSGYLSCLMDLAGQATWAMGEVGWTLETNESQAADIDNRHGDHNGYITTHQSDHSIYIQKPSEGLTVFNIKQSLKLWLYYMFLTHWEVASTHPGWLSIEVSWHQPCTSCVWCFNH
jgi:hypothetical protein